MADNAKYLNLYICRKAVAVQLVSDGDALHGMSMAEWEIVYNVVFPCLVKEINDLYEHEVRRRSELSYVNFYVTFYDMLLASDV